MMMSATTIRGAALYDKKPGILSIAKDQRSLTWVPDSHKPADSITIAVTDITNLQQTPPHVAKVMLKIFVKLPKALESTNYTFHFKSGASPREEANTIKDALSNLLSTMKANDPAVPKANGMNGASATMAMASAVSSKTTSGKWFDDAQLMMNIALQQSLMKKDTALHRMYMEARRTKPENITDSQFNSQFWSTRTTILRSHAVETNQKRGAYHVLAAVKPREVNGELKMNISAEQVQLIFSQHPLIKRVYDENVPRLNEMEFWSRFFLSRLFKKLKGERITLADSTDAIFDRYLDGNNETGLNQVLLASCIPNIIDLEANEENQGGSKSGNRQDFTMRPSSTAKVPIVRVLNSLSGKIMTHVKSSDVDPSAPIGMDEETYNQLVLRDLRGESQEERIMLNIKEQSRFFSSDRSAVSAEAAQYSKQIPAKVLSDLRRDLDPHSMGNSPTGKFDLRMAIDVREDSDSGEEEPSKPAHIGSKASRTQAQQQILAGIISRRSELEGSGTSDLSGLSQKLFDRLTLTHATTTEFLHHFWALFLSGDSGRADELANIVATLERAMDRINAVAADAEVEKEATVKKRKEHVREIFETTGKKLKFDTRSVGGGKDAVMEMMEPTIKALEKGSREYRLALSAEGVDIS